MKRKKIIIVSTSLLLLFITTTAPAQWLIDSYPNLETDVAGSFGSYVNVIIGNHLAININTTLRPSVTGGTATTDYPLVLQTLPSNGNAMVLWDDPATDNIRKIIGLSPAGGIAVFSGNDDQTGSGIRLNSYGSSAYPAGSVQTISQGTGAAGVRAFEHLNWTPGISFSSIPGAMHNIFSLDQNGDTRITGKLSFDFLPGDLAMRSIEGLSAAYGINIYTGNAAAPGTMVSMTSPTTTTSGVPVGLMQFTAAGPASTGLAYNFITGSAPVNALQINNDGNTRIGNYGAPTGNDRLTVDGNIYINSTDNDDHTYRNIYARAAYSGLNVTSGAHTDGSDGACFNAFAWNVTPHGTYPAGPYPGAFVINSNQGGDQQTPLGFGYTNYVGPVGGGGTNHKIIQVGKNGQGCFGLDMDLTNIAPGDILTVKDVLGFYDASDDNYRAIHGNTSAGELVLAAKTTSSDGAWFELCGKTHPTNAGEVRIGSYGTTGISNLWMNYDPGTSSFHSNLILSNAGQTVAGHDMDLSYAVPGDVLTVKDQIGMYSATGGVVSINGNTVNSSFDLRANSPSNASATIELHGNNSFGSGGDDRRGEIWYIAQTVPGAAHQAHNFMHWDGTNLTSSMVISDDHSVVIGDWGVLGTPNVGSAGTPNGYRLYVQYGILTEHVRVALHTSSSEWADFVFAKNYKLMPLNKVADYVKQNKHLPDIPSAEDIKKEGVDLGSMDAKLLQKIEELTLYVIQQEKRIDELQKKIDAQTKN